MKKFAIIMILCTSVLVSGCLKTTTSGLKATPEVRVFWGTKTEVVEFLSKPEARSERWFIQSIGN